MHLERNPPQLERQNHHHQGCVVEGAHVGGGWKTLEEGGGGGGGLGAGAARARVGGLDKNNEKNSNGNSRRGLP